MERLTEAIPMRRSGHAEEVAAMNLWLASDEASYATGATSSWTVAKPQSEATSKRAVVWLMRRAPGDFRSHGSDVLGAYDIEHVSIGEHLLRRTQHGFKARTRALAPVARPSGASGLRMWDT